MATGRKGFRVLGFYAREHGQSMIAHDDRVPWCTRPMHIHILSRRLYIYRTLPVRLVSIHHLHVLCLACGEWRQGEKEKHVRCMVAHDSIVDTLEDCRISLVLEKEKHTCLLYRLPHHLGCVLGRPFQQRLGRVMSILL